MNEDSGGDLADELRAPRRASPPPPALTAEEEAALLAEYGAEGPYDDGIDWAAPSHFRSGLGDGHVFLTGADDAAASPDRDAHHGGQRAADGTGGGVRHTDPLQLYLLDHVPSLMLPDRGTSVATIAALAHAMDTLDQDKATSSSAAVNTALTSTAAAAAPLQGGSLPFADVLRLGKEWARRASLTAQGVPTAALAAHLLTSDTPAPSTIASATGTHQDGDDVEHRRLVETAQRLLAKAAEVLAPQTAEQRDAQAEGVAQALAELQRREALLYDALDQHYDREEVLNAEEEDEEVVRLLRQAREGRRRLCATLAEHGGVDCAGSAQATRAPTAGAAVAEVAEDSVMEDVLHAVMPELPYLCAFETELPHVPTPIPEPSPSTELEAPSIFAAEELLPTLTLPPTTVSVPAKTAVEAWRQTSDPVPRLLMEAQDVLASIANTQLRDAAAETVGAATREAYLQRRRPVSAAVHKAARAPLRHGDREALGLVALPAFVHQLDVLLSPTREEQQQRRRRDPAEPDETAAEKPPTAKGTLPAGRAASAAAAHPRHAAPAAETTTLEGIRRTAAIESFLIAREAAERQRMQAEEDLVEREARAAADVAAWHAEQRAELEQAARGGVTRLEEAQQTAFAELARAAQRDRGLAQQAHELRRLQETEQLAYTLMMEWEVQREQLVQDEALRFRVLLRDAAAEAEQAQVAAQQRRDRAAAAVRAAVDALLDAFEEERRRGVQAVTSWQEAGLDGASLRASAWFTWSVAPLLREQSELREWLAANRKRLEQVREQLAEAAASHTARAGRGEDEKSGAGVEEAPPIELPAHPPVASAVAATSTSLRVLDAQAFVRLLWPALHAAVVDRRQAARHFAKVTLSLEDFQGVEWAQLRCVRLRASVAAGEHRVPRAASEADSILPLTRLVEHLDLSGNPLHEVSLLDAVDAFGALQYLDLSRTELHSLDAAPLPPNELTDRQRRVSAGDRPASSRLTHLRHVSAARHHAVAARLRLVSLDVSSNRLTSLAPLGTVAAASLVRCVATDNRLSSLDAVAGCLQLRELLVPHNQLTSLDAVAGLPLLRELDAGNNALTSVLRVTSPDAKTGAAASPLLLLVDKVFVSYNPLPTLTPLRHIFLCMTQLFVNHAQLTALDDATLSSMPLLVVLQAEGNHIADISGLRHCTRLQSLRLSANRLATLQALEPLRCCRRLATLDLSGNPCCGATATPAAVAGGKAFDAVAAAVYAMVPSLTELNNTPCEGSFVSLREDRRAWQVDALRINAVEHYGEVVSALCWDAAVQQMLEDKVQREAYAQRPVNRARGWEMTAQAEAADAQAVADDPKGNAAARLNDVAAAQIHVRRAERDRRAVLYDLDTDLLAAWCAALDGGAVLANVHVRHAAYAQQEQDHLERCARAWISEWLLGRVLIRRARRELHSRRAAYEHSEGRRRERAARRIQPLWRGAVLRSRLHRLLHPVRDHEQDDEDAYAKVNVDDWLTEDPTALAPVELLFHDVVDSARGLAAVPFDVPASALALSKGNPADASSSRGPTPAQSATFTPVPPRGSGSPRGSSTTSGRRALPTAEGARTPSLSTGKREEEASTPASVATTLEEQWGPQVAAQIRKKQQKSSRSHQQHMRQEFLQDPLRVKREMREDRVQHRPK